MQDTPLAILFNSLVFLFNRSFDLLVYDAVRKLRGNRVKHERDGPEARFVARLDQNNTGSDSWSISVDVLPFQLRYSSTCAGQMARCGINFAVKRTTCHGNYHSFRSNLVTFNIYFKHPQFLPSSKKNYTTGVCLGIFVGHRERTVRIYFVMETGSLRN